MQIFKISPKQLSDQRPIATKPKRNGKAPLSAGRHRGAFPGWKGATWERRVPDAHGFKVAPRELNDKPTPSEPDDTLGGQTSARRKRPMVTRPLQPISVILRQRGANKVGILRLPGISYSRNMVFVSLHYHVTCGYVRAI